MQLTLFDPDAGVDITHRFLPHWFQTGATYFVSFRTADSMPASVLQRWLDERRAWLSAHGINPDDPDWHGSLQKLAPESRAVYHRTFTSAFHDHLDAGHGECLLRRPELSEVVATTILHFDRERYHISDFVVMPNHVHVLMGLIGETLLKDICYSWKKFTARRINVLTGHAGHFWQGESFDHMVRSPEQFEYLRDYIAENPRKAGLRTGEYRHYRADLEQVDP